MSKVLRLIALFRSPMPLV